MGESYKRSALLAGQLHVQERLENYQNHFPKQKGHIRFPFHPEVDDKLKQNRNPEQDEVVQDTAVSLLV